ncbi:MAG: gluconolaconase [Anaerolineae bacterium]|nr:gluconolaconase [Phycisphaerae bacterium]
MLCALALVTLAGCQTFERDAPRARTNDRQRLDDAQLARSADPSIRSIGNLETVALISGPMPTGVTVSKNGRIFLCIPRWGDPVDFTVGELRNGKLVPYPNISINRLNNENQTDGLISVQSVVVDQEDRLWILDTGSINFSPVNPGGPKMLCFDLKTDQIVKRVNFPENVVLPTSYLNDVRFNLTMGKEGVAFITDSSDKGPNGIIVVDLASGESWRKLHDHPSTKADPNFVPSVEGEPLKARPGPGQPEATMKIGADGIAISNDGRTLYYCALASRRTYSVSTDALADGKMSDEETAKSVKEIGPRDFASDGLFTDSNNNLLLTDYENNAVRRRDTNGEQSTYTIIAQDPRLIWPDTLSMDAQGMVYVIANQLNRQPRFHEGKDLRKQPYALFRFKPDDRQRRVALR